MMDTNTLIVDLKKINLRNKPEEKKNIRINSKKRYRNGIYRSS